MKKLSFIAALVLTSELALAQITLSVPDVNVAPGSKVIVPVSISDGEDVTAIQFALTFNTTLLSTPAEGSVLAGGALADHSVGPNLEDGKVTVVIFSGSLSSMTPGPGTVVSIVFEGAAGAALGSSTTLEPWRFRHQIRTETPSLWFPTREPSPSAIRETLPPKGRIG